MSKSPRFLEIPDSYELKLGIFLLVLLLIIVSPIIINDALVKTPPSPITALPLRAASSKEITHGDTSKKHVIFTFDGGDGAQSAEAILTALAKHRVKGTFFLTGKFVERNPDLVRRMVAAGHEIFSHTYDHPHLTTLTDADIAKELQDMENVLRNTAGVSPKPYFRAPYGDRDSRVIKAAFAAGYQSVYWSIDGHDWEESLGTNAAEVHDQIMNNLAPGNIYLMHFGDTITGSILDQLFTEIENRGYSLVSLTQGL